MLEEICCKAPNIKYVMLKCISEGWKEKKNVYHRHTAGDLEKLRKRWDEWTERGGVHDKKKRTGKEPQNTYEEKRNYIHIINTERTRRQIKMEPVMDSVSYSKPRGKKRQ